MTATRYETYIRSNQWERRKVKYFASHPKKCVACGNTEVQLHHLTYARMGYELDSDLMALCNEHHVLVHAVHRIDKNVSLRTATISTVSHVRKVLASRPPEIVFRKSNGQAPIDVSIARVRREQRKRFGVKNPPSQRTKDQVERMRTGYRNFESWRRANGAKD